MHRRLLPLILVLGGCSATTPATSSNDDAGGDAGPACLACGGGAPEDLDASIAIRIRTRLDLCSGQEGCHVSGAAGLEFPPGNELSKIIDVPSTERPDLVRVKPGDPMASYLYLKVQGDGGIDGGRMPLGAPFDPKIPAAFFAWIEAGAPAQ